MYKMQNNVRKLQCQTFQLLSKLFYLYGLNIADVLKDEIEKPGRKIYLLRAIFLFVFVNHFCFFFIDIKLEGPSFIIAFARKIVEFSSIILWYYLFINCNNMFQLSREFFQSMGEFGVFSSKRVVIICAVWIFIVQAIGLTSFLKTTPEEKYSLYLDYYTLGLIWKDHSMNYPLLWIILTLYYFYVNTFHA